jgi:hypothetical protein
MNELILKLWNELSNDTFDGFKQSIELACKAQRNACKREYIHSVREMNTTKINDLAGDIQSAEITEADYE